MTVFDSSPEEYAFATQATSAHQYAEVLSYLPAGPVQVLDAGCGAGYCSLRLAEHAARVVGVDLSARMIALAKSRQAEASAGNAEFLVADLRRLPFRNHSFDFVVSRNVLHLTPMETAAPELCRVIRPRGRLLVQDLVTTHPRLRRLRSWQVLRTLMRVPGMLRAQGLRATWRIFRFRTSPGWLQHVTAGRLVTPFAYQSACRQLLPGCEISLHGEWITVLWEAGKRGNSREL
jgi:ubiquinone/menaquinone biosynthesis C-methylase UbiE